MEGGDGHTDACVSGDECCVDNSNSNNYNRSLTLR